MGFIRISAEPGLCQGRGGAWDHRRCGTWLSGRKQRHTPPNASNPPAGLQGNNSYSYSYYFKTAVCSASNPPNASNPPAGLQGNNSYSYYMPLPSVFQGVQDCRLPALKSKATTLTATATTSRLPFARPQTPQTLPTRPQAPKATTLTATTCPCHLSFTGFKTAVCPPSNPPNPPAGLQGTCHLFFRGFKTAVCPPSNPPNPPNPPAGLQGNNSYSYMPSNPPNASNPPAGLQGNNSYSYYMPLPSVFQGVQDCRLPALKPTLLLQDCRLLGLKPPKRFQPARRPPRQQLLQLLHAPAICLSGGSRLPFARPQIQGNNSYSYSYYFKTAVCSASNPPNASNPPAGLQGNNSYSYYMPLPSVFQGVQDCRLPALKPPKPSRRPPRHLPSVFQGVQDCRLPALKPPKPPKPSRRPPRQQLLQLHALKPPKRFQPSRRPPRQQLLQLLHARAICFSGGSRLPFARPQTPQTLPQASKATTLTATCPQTPQTLPTLPQASKATTLTATTCPCHLFFRGFKTAVCPASNPPNASNPPAGLQGNNSYSYYMPLPSVFQGVQDCRLPALTPPKPSRRPPRHLPSVFQGVQACRLAALKPPKPSRRPPRQQLLQLHALKPPKRFQPSRRPPRQQLLQLLHAPAICFSGGSRLPFARPQTPETLPTLPQASKATTRVELGSRVASKGTRPQTLPTLPQASKATTLTATATTSRLPFARPQTPQTLPTRPQASKATTLTATTCPCHLSFRGFKTAACPPSNPPNPPAGLQQLLQLQLLLQDCRLLGLKPPKRFQPARRPPRQQLLQLLHAPAICLSGGSRLPFARPQTPQTLPQASKAPAICFSRGFKTAVCPPSNPPNPPAGLQGNNSYSYMPSNPPNASNPPAGLQGNNSYSYYMPLPSVFQGVQDCRLPALKPPLLLQDCRLLGLKPPKRFQPARRPPRQQLLQLLHAPAICLTGGSRLPFARPQIQGNNSYSYSYYFKTAVCSASNPQTLPTRPQASKATTLTATTCPCHLSFRGFKTAVCPPSNPPNPPAGLQGTCHLFFRGFKTAVCPPSNPSNPPNPPNPPAGLQGNSSYSYMPTNPPNASNPPAGLQGNNSYSDYMPLPSVFQGVQDCRLPALKPPKPSRRPPRQPLLQLHALKPPKRFQPSRRPPRQQLLQLLHAPAICFSGGSSLPFARPQTPQTLPTLPQASKATTLTATTCPCHLFFRGFKTAVCPPSNPPNPPAGLQGTCHLFFRGFKPAVWPPSNPPNPPAGLQGNNSYSYYMPLPSVFQGFSRGSRLPFARPQTPQTLPTLPQASKATTLTATTCPCHLSYRGFKTAVCPPSNPRQQLLQLQLLLQDCRLLGLKPPKRFQPARRPPRQQLLQLLHAPAICLSGGSRLPFARPQTPQTLPQASKAPAICFSGGSRLPFARPQTPQTPQTLPQASKATTLTATCPQTPQTLPTLPQASKATTLTATTCPCHLFFRGFKTAVCPPSNPPNPPAGLQGNHSYSYMPSNPPNASNPPAGLQGNNSYSYYMPLPSVFSGVQACRLPGLKPPKRFQPSRRPPRQQLLQLLHAPAICFSGGSRLPFARPQTPQTLPQASKAPAICFSGGSSLPFGRPQTPQTLPQASKATTLTATCPQTPQTLPTLPQASKATTLTATTCPCHLFFRGFKTAVCPASNPPNASNPPAGLQGNNSYSYYMPLPSVFQGVQDCRLPALKPPKPSRRPPRHLPSVFQGVQACRLAALKPPKPSRRPPRQELLQLHALKPPKRFQPSRRPPRQQLLQLLHAPAICLSGGSRLPLARPQTPQTFPQASKAPAICFSGGSRLPFARPQTPQTLPQASKATTLTATCPQTPQKLPTLPQASKATTLTATTCLCHLLFRGFKTAVCPPSNPPNPPAGLQGNNSYSYMPSNPPNASNPPAGLQGNNSYSYYMPLPSVFPGVQDCRLPGLKPPKRFQPSRRPPRQQLLQLLHAPAICFSGGSSLPFARPQTLPQASKATTLTATCPQTPQTLPTLPQASKATTLTATTCPCHLFFRGFKTAVCPASNPLNASNPPAGLQGNNPYSYYMPLPSVFQGVQDCRRPRPLPRQGRRLGPPEVWNLALGSQAKAHAPKRFQPSRRPPRQQLLQLQLLLQDCRLLGLKPPKRFQPARRPPRQQLLQLLHAPAICLSGGSRLLFARPQIQGNNSYSYSYYFKTAVCSASNPPNASNPPAGLQGNNSYSYYMPLPSVFQGVQDCRLPALKPPKPSRRPPRHLPSVFQGVQDCAGLQGNNSYSYMPLPSVFQGVHGLQEPVIHRLFWGFCSGTNHFVFLHGFPAGVSWLT